MTMTLAAGKCGGVPARGRFRHGRRRLRRAADSLGLAAAPVFALMAVNAAGEALAASLCAPHSGVLGGMTAMYALMSLFHLPLWLKRAAAPRRPVPIIKQHDEGE